MFEKLKNKLKDNDAASERQSAVNGQQSQSQLHPSNPYYNPRPVQQHGIRASEKYQTPPGPPPGHTAADSGYAPPPGPPPSHQTTASEYAPPPGPPPNYPQQPPPSWEPPPYHDWTVIPDTALLPPPPSMGYEDSPTANASDEEGGIAYRWCKNNPLWPPQNLTPPQHAAIQNSQLALLKPPSYSGNLAPQRNPGHWKCRTIAKCRDTILMTNLPIYSVFWDSPLRTGQRKTIYFEIKLHGLGSSRFSRSEADSGIAIGFVAPPYPTWRLPGWQRGSLGVHGDDGRKYINNTFGGSDFTTTFRAGEVLGIGMTFSTPSDPPSYEQSQTGKILDIDVFFTRNGKREGGWDGNGELEEESEGGTVGLRGDCDLFPAVGMFGGTDFEVFFHPNNWLYRPL